MKKIEHIGIAVKNLEKSNKLFTALLGTPPYKMETVESENVKTSFFKIGDVKIELLESLSTDGPIAKYIAHRGEGIHHIAFAVENIENVMEKCVEQGFSAIHTESKEGADNKCINFLHPRTTNGVLVELCQEKE